MKLFKRFVSWTIWGIILINLMLMGVSHIPAAQRFIGSKVADAVGRQLGTEVSIGRVDMGFFNRIIIDDLRILDQRKKPMANVSRLSAKVDIGTLIDGRISISSAQLFGARLTLYRQKSDAPHNFQFVLDSLAPKDTTTHTPLDLRINSLIIRRSSVAYDVYDQPKTPGKFNPAHMMFAGLSANITLRALTDDSINVNVKRFGCVEQSGLFVNRISFRFEAGRREALLSKLLVQMPSSQLQIDTIQATYRMDEKGFIPGSVQYKGSITQTNITPSDLRCFVPSLKNFQRAISVESDFNGTDQQATIQALRIATQERDIDLAVSGWVERFSQPAWHLQMNHVNLSENSLDFLSKIIPQIPQELRRIGNLQLTGTFDRTLQGNTSLKTLIRSGAGSVDTQFDITSDKIFKGKLSTDGISLRQILANEHFGQLSTNITLTGQLREQKKHDITVDGTVSQFDYNGYTYHDITLNGSYRQGAVSGYFGIDDPHLAAQMQGEITEGVFEDSSQKANKVRLVGEVIHLVPAALHLTEQFGSAVLSGNIDADFTARTLNDAQGSLHVSNFTISATEQQPAYRLDNLMLTSGYDKDIHFLTLKSDFADAEIKGHFDYGSLKQSFTNLIASKLPTLPGLPPVRHTDNNFNLRLLVSKTDWLQRFLGVDIQLRQPLSLQAQVNDLSRIINLEGDFPSFAYNGAWYSDGAIHMTSPAEAIKCDLQLTKLMDNGHHLMINLQADASDNNLTTALKWDNHHPDERMNGELNTIIRLYRNIADKSEAHVRIMPSHVLLNNSKWSVEPSDILYSENRLLVDRFAIHHGDQHIIIDGFASKRAEDSITVDLNDVEVAYILDLVNFHSVEFSGKATGRAHASSLFDKFAASADLDVSDFKFERGRMGVLHAHAKWNQELEQIDIQAVADDGPDAYTDVNGYISPVYNTIDLAIDAHGTYIDFMHNFTSSFLSHVTGHAEGHTRLSGTLDNINLTGKVVVDGEATVTSLNTTYQLRRDTVVMIPDEIELHRVPIYDRNDHMAYLSGGIHHQHLTNLTFDLSVDAEDLLAFDFNDFGDSSFYGTVYATGKVDIHGRPGEVTINCDVTPESNTVFVYNAANPVSVSRQEFIEWEEDDEFTVDSLRFTGNSLRFADDKSVVNTRITDTDIYINFLINTTPAATVKLLMDANTKDYITLNGEGAIRATFHNKGPFNMFGTYTVERGTYGITIQNIIKKNFTFNRGGTIVFGGDPYNAALKLQAVYTVNGVSLSDLNIGNSFTNNTIRVNCLMNIGGQPNAPQVDFDLEMPTVNADEQQMVRSIINGQQEMNQQVVYLLGIGRFYNQGANNSTTGQQTDQTSLAMQSFLSGTLSTQINTLLNQIIKNDNWNFGANISTGNEGWHNAEYEGIINGRMLNNRLLFNGQFGYRDNATRANPSFIGDFDVQYLLFPNGNLALKVYNQTNDRYFTKSSLNTQGIGIIMKKDFGRLRELFTSSRRKGKTSPTKPAPSQKP
ncbi:MAG: translocation/assembly module TamB domain-containing protein [Prevotella sp.]|nr:translocation/assembly module TamB domain-containing protein [Prevotella sp.]